MLQGFELRSLSVAVKGYYYLKKKKNQKQLVRNFRAGDSMKV